MSEATVSLSSTSGEYDFVKQAALKTKEKFSENLVSLKEIHME